MSRLRSNCRVIVVAPTALADVISETPAMRLNCRSSGVAIDDATISGVAPGRPALTEMVGKSTCGSGETGRPVYATAPANAMAMERSVVATGRWMKMDEGFMGPDDGRRDGRADRRTRR